MSIFYIIGIVVVVIIVARISWCSYLDIYKTDNVGDH